MLVGQTRMSVPPTQYPAKMRARCLIWQRARFAHDGLSVRHNGRDVIVVHQVKSQSSQQFGNSDALLHWLYALHGFSLGCPFGMLAAIPAQLLHGPRCWRVGVGGKLPQLGILHVAATLFTAHDTPPGFAREEVFGHRHASLRHRHRHVSPRCAASDVETSIPYSRQLRFIFVTVVRMSWKLIWYGCRFFVWRFLANGNW